MTITKGTIELKERATFLQLSLVSLICLSTKGIGDT